MDDFIFDPSLVLYLPLHQLDGASIMSRDHYGHLCSVSGALWTPNGRKFDGVDDVINCGDGVSLDITGNLTLEVWVKLDEIGALQFFAGRDDGTNRNYYMLIDTNNKADFTCIGLTATTIEADTVLTTGQFYHIVGTYNGAYLNTFLNGEVDATPVAATGVTDNDDVSFTIGERITGARDLEGVVGEVRVYSRALNPLEIHRNYLATKWRYR